VGVAIRKVGRLEVLTGLLVGLTLAVTFGAVGLVLWGEPSVVLTVSVAG
jgi:Mg/Co/Ni transporter MgtE